MGESNRKKVLVVDDEPTVVKYLETLLQDNGYGTVPAFNGREGLEKVREELPDLVLLDLSMPEKSGVKFYRELREDPVLKGIPVIVVTAVTGYAGDPHGFKKFMDTQKQLPPPEGYLPKPIDREELLALIDKILTRSSHHLSTAAPYLRTLAASLLHRRSSTY